MDEHWEKEFLFSRLARNYGTFTTAAVVWRPIQATPPNTGFSTDQAKEPAVVNTRGDETANSNNNRREHEKKMVVDEAYADRIPPKDFLVSGNPKDYYLSKDEPKSIRGGQSKRGGRGRSRGPWRGRGRGDGRRTPGGGSNSISQSSPSTSNRRRPQPRSEWTELFKGTSRTSGFGTAQFDEPSTLVTKNAAVNKEDGAPSEMATLAMNDEKLGKQVTEGSVFDRMTSMLGLQKNLEVKEEEGKGKSPGAHTNDPQSSQPFPPSSSAPPPSHSAPRQILNAATTGTKHNSVLEEEEPSEAKAFLEFFVTETKRLFKGEVLAKDGKL